MYANNQRLYIGMITHTEECSDTEQFLYILSIIELRLFSQKRQLKNAQNRNRTSDTRIFSPLLYQLSYLGVMVVFFQKLYIMIE